LRWDAALKGRPSTKGAPRGKECPRHKHKEDHIAVHSEG
jgi:hypothetical protein